MKFSLSMKGLSCKLRQPLSQLVPLCGCCVPSCCFGSRSAVMSCRLCAFLAVGLRPLALCTMGRCFLGLVRTMAGRLVGCSSSTHCRCCRTAVNRGCGRARCPRSRCRFDGRCRRSSRSRRRCSCSPGIRFNLSGGSWPRSPSCNRLSGARSRHRGRCHLLSSDRRQFRHHQSLCS